MIDPGLQVKISLMETHKRNVVLFFFLNHERVVVGHTDGYFWRHTAEFPFKGSVRSCVRQDYALVGGSDVLKRGFGWYVPTPGSKQRAGGICGKIALCNGEKKTFACVVCETGWQGGASKCVPFYGEKCVCFNILFIYFFV